MVVFTSPSSHIWIHSSIRSSIRPFVVLNNQKLSSTDNWNIPDHNYSKLREQNGRKKSIIIQLLCSYLINTKYAHQKHNSASFANPNFGFVSFQFRRRSGGFKTVWKTFRGPREKTQYQFSKYRFHFISVSPVRTHKRY